MKLSTLTLVHFKNYQKQDFEFHTTMNCFVGNNGMGKTNILDAIYTLGMSKSHFLGFDRLLVKEGESFFRIEGNLIDEDTQRRNQYVIKYVKGGKKSIEHNGKTIVRRIEHIGKIPLVFIAPDDQIVIQGGSIERRKFLDQTISQFDKNYLHALSQYNKLLKQKNAHLQNQYVDSLLLDALDDKMSANAVVLIEGRQRLIRQFQPLFLTRYNQISGGDEEVQLVFSPNVEVSRIVEVIRSSREKDILMRRTQSGPHRDDVKILINKKPARQFASQGQLKSILLALKLTQIAGLRTNISAEPLFLIDDLFDKLDERRIRLLMKMLTEEGQTQIFITYTNKDRLRDILKEFNISYKLFEIENGTINNEETQ